MTWFAHGRLPQTGFAWRWTRFGPRGLAALVLLSVPSATQSAEYTSEKCNLPQRVVRITPAFGSRSASRSLARLTNLLGPKHLAALAKSAVAD